MSGNKAKKLETDFEKEHWIFKYSIFVGRIAEVPVYINFSFAFVFILITLSLSTTILPNFSPGLEQSNYLIAGIVCALISLFSILFHETAHSNAARKFVTMTKILLPVIVVMVSSTLKKHLRKFHLSNQCVNFRDG